MTATNNYLFAVIFCVITMSCWGSRGNTQKLVGEKSAPPAKEPVKVVFDTDMLTDFDDVGALACLHALADAGECEILATVSSTRGNASVGAVEIINRYYGRADIPVGAPKGMGVMGAFAGNIPTREEIRKDSALQLRCGYGMGGRSAWDETAVLIAVRGTERYFNVERGTYRMVGKDGENEWAPDENGSHLRVTEKLAKAEVAKIIDELMCRAPRREQF